MSKPEARRKAFEAIKAVKLPPGWEDFADRWAFTAARHRRSQDGEITGWMSFSALGTTPGRIEVRCWSMTVTTSIERLPAAVEACLKWLEGESGVCNLCNGHGGFVNSRPSSETCLNWVSCPSCGG